MGTADSSIKAKSIRVNNQLWEQFRAKCTTNGIALETAVSALIELYLSGEIEIQCHVVAKSVKKK